MADRSLLLKLVHIRWNITELTHRITALLNEDYVDDFLIAQCENRHEQLLEEYYCITVKIENDQLCKRHCLIKG